MTTHAFCFFLRLSFGVVIRLRNMRTREAGLSTQELSPALFHALTMCGPTHEMSRTSLAACLA